MITSRSILSSRAQSLEFYGVRWDCELASGPLQLPRQIQFLRDTNLDLSIKQELRRPEIPKPDNAIRYEKLLSDLEARKDYPHGFLWATYQGLEWTNLNAGTLPLKFEYECFSPTLATPEGLKTLVVGMVTNVSQERDGTITLPPILASLSVNDARFRSADARGRVDAINYQLTPGETWPDRNSPALRALFKKADRTVFEPGKAKLLLRVGAVIFFLGVLGLLIWLNKGGASRRVRRT